MVVIRNGVPIDLGIVSYYHRNPIKRWWGNLKIKIREFKRKMQNG